MFQNRRPPAADEVSLAPGVGLTRARAHEAAGPARAVFAFLVAARLAGPVLWLHPQRTIERLMGHGVRRFIEPGRLVLVRPPTPEEILWAAEEALRTGLAPLVVAELPEPPRLTRVRRLHLAAETGAAKGTAPIALILTSGGDGAPGVETRWHLVPTPGCARDDSASWHLTRACTRMAPPASWVASLSGDRLRLDPAS
jgi:protein ImuA